MSTASPHAPADAGLACAAADHRIGRIGHIGRAERIRLWLSYQRYAFLLVALAALVVTAVAWIAPHAGWWLWPLAPVPVYIVYRLLGFAREVHGRWPRKLRATLLASQRIATGRFRPASVRAYCGDPCFRVVADEILRRSGMARTERRDLIRQFRHQASEPTFLVVVNTNGAVTVRGAGSPGGTMATDTHNMEPT